MRIEDRTLLLRVPEFEGRLEITSPGKGVIWHVQKAWVKDGELELGEKTRFEEAAYPEGIQEPRKWTVGEGDVNIFWWHQANEFWTIDMVVPGTTRTFLSATIWEEEEMILSKFEYSKPQRFIQDGEWTSEHLELPGRSGDFVTVTDTTYRIHVPCLETEEV
jgi:hypothetical protein